MAYIGRSAINGHYQKFDSIVSQFNNVKVTFGLTVSSANVTPASPYNITVCKNGQFLEPNGLGNAFTISDSTITFTEAPKTTDKIWMVRAGERIPVAVDDGHISDSKFQPGSVTYDKLSQDCKDIIIGEIVLFGN